MLSVLPTSWQRHLGPGRRRRCGNGAARVAEPAFAPARSPPEALPALPSAPRAAQGTRAGEGSRAPRERGPRGGAARELEAARLARAAARRRGGAAWPGRLGAGAEEGSGPPGGATGPAPSRTSPGGRADRPRHRRSPGYPEYHMFNNLPCDISQCFSLPPKYQNCSGNWRYT